MPDLNLWHTIGSAIADMQGSNCQIRGDWKTKSRGTDDQEYQIYVTNAESLGWRVKSYEEWKRS